MTALVTVNGRPCALPEQGTATLLDLLRDQLMLTGAKRGCDYGVCGTCSVLIDGVLGRACLTLAADCAGRSVTTVEALDAGGTADPIQRCLVAAGAVQCGFCTPAMVLAGRALLDANPRPSRAEIVAAISGNICRCSGYGAIVEAIAAAAHG